MRKVIVGKISLFLLLFIITSMNAAFASKIPESIESYLKESFPNARVRFDGLIEIEGGTQYLPVFPMQYKKTETPSAIVKTIPESLSLKDKPDLVFFDNNFSLMKILRVPGELPTLVSSNEIPLEVKLGLLPQDLLVPTGLVIPPELRIILGDLRIPIKDTNKFKQIADSRKKNIKKVSLIKDYDEEVQAPETQEIAHSIFFISNFNSSSIYLVKPEVGRPYKSLKLDSVPLDMETTNDHRYILIPGFSSDKVSVVDAVSDEVVKEIPVGKSPSSIVVDRNKNLAYVSNRDSSTISVIDLVDMEFLHNINVEGKPQEMVISLGYNELYYLDSIKHTVNSISLGDYNIQNELLDLENISKICDDKNYLYILSRSKGQMLIYDKRQGKIVDTVKVGQKPVDVKVINDKVYVLNAGSDSITIIDPSNSKNIVNVDIKSGGFPKGIVTLDYGNKFLITNVSAYEILVFDMDKQEVVKRLPVSVNVGSMVISKILK